MEQTTCQFCSDADGAPCVRRARFAQDDWALCRAHSDRNHRRPLARPTLVYALQSSDARRSYVGATNDFARRLREHNGLVKNRGARYTRRAAVDPLRPNWTPVFQVSGFRGRRLVTLPSRPRNPFGASAAARRAWWLYWALKKERFSQSQTTPTARLVLEVAWSQPALYAAARRLPDWGPAAVRHRLV